MPVLAHFGPRPTALTIQHTDPSDPDGQVHFDIAGMWDAIRKDAAHPLILAAVAEAGANRGNRTFKSRAVWAWVRRHVRFQDDNEILSGELGLPGAFDLLIEPSRLLTMPQPMGDCDDQTMLAGAMLTAAGVPFELVVSASDPETPERFSHVYLQTKLESGANYNLDCSHGTAPGWEVPRRFRRAVFGLSPQYIGSLGLGTVMDDYGNVINENYDQGYPEQWTSEVYYGSDSNPSSSGSGSTAWANLIGNLTKPGAILNPLHPGEYIQTAAGVQSRTVPGAAPYPSGSGGALPSISPTVLLIGGLGLAAALAFGSRK